MQDGYLKILEMREKLNAVSPSLCLAKWLQVSIHLPTGRTHSCYHPQSHKIPLGEVAANPSALHNTNYKKLQRKLMKEGERPAECDYCWKVEDLAGDHVSDRHIRSSEDWAATEFKTVVDSPWDVDVVPKYVEVNFNHACQLKCSYCSPQLSSAWMKEIKEFGPYPTLRGHNRLDWLEKNDLVPIPPSQANPYVDAFWKWWPQVYPRLRIFRMTGGEPLLDPNTFRILDYVNQNANPRLTLSLTSNMCPPDAAFDRFLAQTRSLIEKNHIGLFCLFASIDSVGAQAEYMRFGLNYEQFEKNVEKYLAIPGTQISFILTFNNLCVGSLTQYLEWIVALRRRHNDGWQRIHFDTPFLRSPEFQSLQMLDEPTKLSLRDQVKAAEQLMSNEGDLGGLTEVEIAKLNRLAAWASEDVARDFRSEKRADFYLYFQEHDRRRKTDFGKTFPELKDFWALCQQEASRFGRI